jgi:hypothetical protein
MDALLRHGLRLGLGRRGRRVRGVFVGRRQLGQPSYAILRSLTGRSVFPVVPELHDTCRVLSDIDFVRDQDDRNPALDVRALKIIRPRCSSAYRGCRSARRDRIAGS